MRDLFPVGMIHTADGGKWKDIANKLSNRTAAKIAKAATMRRSITALILACGIAVDTTVALASAVSTTTTASKTASNAGF
jgi:hypothetical protein